MNIYTLKLLVWAAMHHPYFRYVRVESPIVLGFFAAYDRRLGFEIFIQPARVYIPYEINLAFDRATAPPPSTIDDDIPF